MQARLAARTHPMNNIEADEGSRLIETLEGLDGNSRARVWGGAADAVRDAAQRAEREGRSQEAAGLYARASGLYFMGRFPCPNHPAKERCAIAERETYLAASRYWSAPIQRISAPFAGRAGEGREVIGLLRRPAGVAKPRVVIMWGGVDAW